MSGAAATPAPTPKRRRGRPPNDEPTKPVTVRMPAERVAELRKYAREQHLHTGKVMADALAKYFEPKVGLS